MENNDIDAVFQMLLTDLIDELNNAQAVNSNNSNNSESENINNAEANNNNSVFNGWNNNINHPWNINNAFNNNVMNNFLSSNIIQENIIQENYPFYINSSPNSQNVLHQSLYDRNPIKNVITEEVKNSLIPIKFNQAVDKEINDKCCILVEKFNDDDNIIQLPCNHCFFVEPIIQWLTEESCECPVCRHKFESMEKKTILINDDDMEVEINGVEDIPDLIENFNQINIDNPDLLFSHAMNSFFSDEIYYDSEANSPVSEVD
jgi:hypothetical protein